MKLSKMWTCGVLVVVKRWVLMVGIRCLSCSLSEGFCILGFGVENGRVWMQLQMWLHLRLDGKNLVDTLEGNMVAYITK